jgi:hypothetical protein
MLTESAAFASDGNRRRIHPYSVDKRHSGAMQLVIPTAPRRNHSR